MRADQPLRSAASPTVKIATARTLTHPCEGWPERFLRAGPGDGGRPRPSPPPGTRAPLRSLLRVPCRVCARTAPDLCRFLPSGLGRAGAAVGVLEPHDVVDLRGRDFQDRRVLE